MKQTNYEKVKEFHEKFNIINKEFPTLPDESLESLRLSLIKEELEELENALSDKNIVEVADALTDLLYVVYGAGLVFGIDLDKCFEEVHYSNMSKLGEDGNPIYREDGKVLKGPNFFSPNLEKILLK